MKVGSLLEVESCSRKARVLTYALLLIPIAYLAMAMGFIAITIDNFDYRFIAMSQSEVQIPFWVLSAFVAAFCAYESKVTWSFFTEFRNLKTNYIFNRALKESRRKEKVLNFDDYLRSLGIEPEEPKDRKSILQKVDDLLPW